MAQKYINTSVPLKCKHTLLFFPSFVVVDDVETMYNRNAFGRHLSITLSSSFGTHLSMGSLPCPGGYWIAWQVPAISHSSFEKKQLLKEVILTGAWVHSCSCKQEPCFEWLPSAFCRRKSLKHCELSLCWPRTNEILYPCIAALRRVWDGGEALTLGFLPFV